MGKNEVNKTKVNGFSRLPLGRVPSGPDSWRVCTFLISSAGDPKPVCLWLFLQIQVVVLFLPAVILMGSHS